MSIISIELPKFYRTHRLFVHSFVTNSTDSYTSFSGIIEINTQDNVQFTMEDVVDTILDHISNPELTSVNIVVNNVVPLGTSDRQGWEMLKDELDTIDRLLELNCIKLWAFDRAPMKYRELSQYGGGEDWIVFSPHISYEDEAEKVVDRLKGYCYVESCRIDGGRIWIIAH